MIDEFVSAGTGRKKIGGASTFWL